jgi:hypothetical protein
MRATSTSIAALTSTAVHEAGHIVVAYALGRRVTFIRIGRQMVPADHPHAELLQGSVTGGESRFGPALATEINYRVNTGTPLAADHLEWLRAELVTCFAGALAETRLLGEMDPEGAVADLKQASIIVGLLGITADADGGAARLERAEGVAQRVIAELSACVEQVAAALSQGPCEFDESSAHSLLEQSGVKPGTHRRLLDELAAERSDDA